MIRDIIGAFFICLPFILLLLLLVVLYGISGLYLFLICMGVTIFIVASMYFGFKLLFEDK